MSLTAEITRTLQAIPGIGEIMRANDAAEQQRRTARVAKLAELRAAHPALVAARDRDRARHGPIVERTRTAFTAAQAALAEAERKHAGPIADSRRRIEAVEQELLASVDPRIAEARSGVSERFDHDRHKMPKSDVVPTDQVDPDTRKPLWQRRTNAAACQRVAAAVNAARVALDALVFDAPEDLPAAIRAILAPLDAAWRRLDELEPLGPPVTRHEFI